jgi:hypothetical protein
MRSPPPLPRRGSGRCRRGRAPAGLPGWRAGAGAAACHTSTATATLPSATDAGSRLGSAAGMDLALATGRGELLLTHWPVAGSPLVTDDDVIQIGDREQLRQRVRPGAARALPFAPAPRPFGRGGGARDAGARGGRSRSRRLRAAPSGGGHTGPAGSPSTSSVGSWPALSAPPHGWSRRHDLRPELDPVTRYAPQIVDCLPPRSPRE